jgi:hypothetical protein
MKKILALTLLILAALSQGHSAKGISTKQLVITNVTIRKSRCVVRAVEAKSNLAMPNSHGLAERRFPGGSEF